LVLLIEVSQNSSNFCGDRNVDAASPSIDRQSAVQKRCLKHSWPALQGLIEMRHQIGAVAAIGMVSGSAKIKGIR